MATTVTSSHEPEISEKNIATHGIDIEKSPSNEPQDKGEESDGTTFKQNGVKGIEATTSVWDYKTLWLMFCLLYLVSFSDKLLMSIQSNLNPYITSSFEEHGLTPTVSIAATILSGVLQMPIAKILDVWGRVEGFMVLIFINVLGNIIKCTCQNMFAYAAGHTIYWAGHIGLLYVIDIMLADMTTLRNRIIIYGLNGTPLIATTFAGPKIAELFYEQVNFRWAFGAFIIILVAFCIPVIMVLLWHRRKAYKQGLLVKESSGRTWYQSIWYYIIQLDALGLLLCMVGWALLLLPFNLASSAGKGWKNASMIAMEIIGFFTLVAWVVWEKYFAPIQMLPFRYLKDRTIIGACLLYGIMFCSIFCWDSYYYSYLQVAHDLDISTAGYVLNSFSLASAILSPFIGVVIRYTGDYKYFSYGGIPFVTLGTALLIHFRKPETSVALLVMCQVFNGIGTGIWASCAQLGIMASVDHQQIAICLALFGLFGSIGAALGYAIAGALWVNILPAALMRELPEGSKDLWSEIFSSLVIQQQWPVGDPIRDAIIRAYADVQRKMVIAGSALVPLMVICIIMFKNTNVRKLEEEKGKQTKGAVF